MNIQNTKGHQTSDEERIVLSDCKTTTYTKQVKNKCAMCGIEVIKSKKLARARCFDCRKKKNIEYATKGYKNKHAKSK